jgi:hypothetical protein
LSRNCFRLPAMPLATQRLSSTMRNVMSPESISQESLRASGWDRFRCSGSPAGTETAAAGGGFGKGPSIARVGDVTGFTWAGCLAMTSFSRTCECQPSTVLIQYMIERRTFCSCLSRTPATPLSVRLKLGKSVPKSRTLRCALSWPTLGCVRELPAF